jgi:hypothetical protein
MPSSDSGVISRAPSGCSRMRRLRLPAMSPCQLPMGIPTASQSGFESALLVVDQGLERADVKGAEALARGILDQAGTDRQECRLGLARRGWRRHDQVLIPVQGQRDRLLLDVAERGPAALVHPAPHPLAEQGVGGGGALRFGSWQAHRLALRFPQAASGRDCFPAPALPCRPAWPTPGLGSVRAPRAG